MNRYARDFAKYAALNVLGMAGLSCYILADTFFIARGLGTSGLAALNLAIPVYSFIHGTGLMLGMGGAVKYSVYRSQAEYEEANAAFTRTMYGTAVLALAFFMTGLFLSDAITNLLGADEAVFSMTRTYLTVILLFAPAFILNDVLLCFVRNDGNPRLSMLAMLSGSIANIVLDYLFIFPLGMGIFGAVLATGLAPLISMFILLTHRVKKNNGFHLRKVKPGFAMLRSILSLGVPSLITEASSGIVILVFNAIILNLQGNVGVAAYGVIANLSLVVIAIDTGIAQGSQPLVSKAYGKGDLLSVRRVLRYAVGTVLFLSGLLYLLVWLCADPVTSLFNSEKDRQLQEIAAAGLRLYFTAAPFAGFNVILTVFFTAVERAVPAQIISLMRGFCIIVPMALILSAAGGMTGVWMAFPAAEFLVACIGAGLYQKNKNRLIA